MEEAQAESYIEAEFAGKVWKLRRLKNRDWAFVHDHMRSRRVALATRDWKENRIDDAHYRFALHIVYDPTRNFSLIDDILLLQVAEAQPVILWLSIRDHHPEIKLEAVEEMMGSKWGIEMVNALNRFYSEEEEQEAWNMPSQENLGSEIEEASRR